MKKRYSSEKIEPQPLFPAAFNESFEAVAYWNSCKYPGFQGRLNVLPSRMNLTDKSLSLSKAAVLNRICFLVSVSKR
jgi:hypothetical protein